MENNKRLRFSLIAILSQMLPFLMTYSLCIYNRLLLNILYVINQKYGLNL